MMSIKEYLEMIREAEGYDAMEDAEIAMYELYEDDYDAFEQHCHAKGIDLGAREAGSEETVLTFWVWDMCGE